MIEQYICNGCKKITHIQNTHLDLLKGGSGGSISYSCLEYLLKLVVYPYMHKMIYLAALAGLPKLRTYLASCCWLLIHCKKWME